MITFCDFYMFEQTQTRRKERMEVRNKYSGLPLAAVANRKTPTMNKPLEKTSGTLHDFKPILLFAFSFCV